jgi:hypothetical protein
MSGMVTGAAKRLTTGELDSIEAIIGVVDRRGREMDEKWGVGRLPTLVSIEIAERFTSQQRKFSEALHAWDLEQSRRHGEAMIRAYAKLDELAETAGAEHGRPEQWEFDTPEGLVILVRDRSRAAQVDTQGRQAQVWSLDEVRSVIRQHPILAAAKDAFPGAQITSIRPGRDRRDALSDSLEGLPF